MYPTLSFSGLEFQTYLVWTSLTICLGLVFFLRRMDFDRRVGLDLFMVLTLSSFLGARLFHVFYEEPQYYLENWRRAFEFWNGGYVFFGGFLGAMAGGNLFWHLKSRSHKGLPSRAQIHDLFAPIISFTYAFGRLGCFWAGCCYGRWCELPWAQDGRHPTAIYSSICEVGVLLILLRVEKKKSLGSTPGRLFWLWLGLHSTGRFFIEFFRDDFRGPDYIFSVSAWISVILGSLALFQLLRQRSPQKKDKGI
jgi:phosphatidylglycerol---prolipoprotein diacylglyceryl transferase